MNWARVLIGTCALAGAIAPWSDADDASVEPGRSGWSAAADIGPDVSFCQLYYLLQYGRVDDVVGLAVAATSWNVGDAPLDSIAYPSPLHPFTINNLYRLKDDRFEQIGQSWAFHWFCSLDNAQCGGTCVPTGCSSLGVNCTATTSSALMASQNGLGPRYEINPWTGAWDFVGSHLSQGYHEHNPIEHRLQVRDVDLDPASNPDAAYFVESFFCSYQDVNAMNSVAWKPVTPYRHDTIPDRWEFEMTDNWWVYPNIGWAVDAWAGATQTVVAQEVPVVEFVSPDGRCLLAAKATDLGGGAWHYEYALLNIDMNRQVGSFSVPIAAGTTIANVGFHAPHHHDEPVNTCDADAAPIDNAPWTHAVTDDAVTWSTTTNPVRWGTLYNFRFDADRDRASTSITLGLFRPGTPSIVQGSSIGPFAAPGYDECEGRVSMTCGGTTAVDNTHATTAPDDPMGSCWFVGSGYGGIGTVFLEFVPTAPSARIRTDTVVVPPAYDSEFAVYAVDQADVCDKTAWIEIGCSENDGAGEGAFNGDVCVFGLTPGSGYIVELAAFVPDTRGTYTLDVTCPCDVVEVDCNGNGIDDREDIASGTSPDCDGNGVPDECDPDLDGDGVPDACDNCPQTWNPGQEDWNDNGVGDACACLDDSECQDESICTWDVCSNDLCQHLPNVYGDVTHNGTVNPIDVFCVLYGAAGDFSDCPLRDVDIHPCDGNDVVNVFDVFAVLDAIAGVDPCCAE